MARLTAVVDFPTPPLPDPTAITFLMPPEGLKPACTACTGILILLLTSFNLMPFVFKFGYLTLFTNQRLLQKLENFFYDADQHGS
jgi:hypothetical protein